MIVSPFSRNYRQPFRFLTYSAPHCTLLRTATIEKPSFRMAFLLAVRARGIEPPSTGWKPVVLPLNYARISFVYTQSVFTRVILALLPSKRQSFSRRLHRVLFCHLSERSHAQSHVHVYHFAFCLCLPSYRYIPFEIG